MQVSLPLDLITVDNHKDILAKPAKSEVQNELDVWKNICVKYQIL